MSVGTWEPPGQKKRTNIELSLIRRFLSFAESVDFEHKLDYTDFRSAGLEKESWARGHFDGDQVLKSSVRCHSKVEQHKQIMKLAPSHSEVKTTSEKQNQTQFQFNTHMTRHIFKVETNSESPTGYFFILCSFCVF